MKNFINKHGYFTFIFICVLFVLYSSFANASDYDYYVKIGTGYKFNEPAHSMVQLNDQWYVGENDNGSKFSARFEAGVEKGNLTFGISHHSQWLSGWPIDNKGEYYKTELFVDYKFTFN